MSLGVDLNEALKVALSAVDASRELVRRAGHRGGAVSFKSDRSVVTETDRAVELVIRETIARSYPDHDIVGEEYGALTASSDWCWLVDPIDGTASFVSGLPFFSTLVALCHRDVPMLSVIDFPLGGRAWAMRGAGAWENGERLRVHESFDPERSIVCHGDLYTFEMAGYSEAYRALEQRLPHFRSYTDAFGHYLVATGAVAAVVDAAVEKWEVAAVRLLVEEAGGRVLAFADRADPARSVLMSGTPAAVDWLATNMT
jgi:fructose-1,6-bisphosphatase/inositol monophosphatase family enzyme